MEKKIGGVTLKITKGDIANQNDVQAIVNAANRELRTGGGVAGAIHRGAGPELEQECRQYAPITPGEAVITGAHNLPNDYVIHCLGPVYGVDKPHDELLIKCYKNVLKKADEHEIRSVAFPAISTGAFGYPIEEATEIALDTVKAQADKLKNIELIKFVLFDDNSFKTYQEKTKEIV
ncbi:macro domain-containing protein [Natranaerobius thermophilus]|uniref:Appr-1-p processing domain protein n=1 Tax=Natranaerobius thermophilus (strain ATCC BAA-1301 / DSM 18059 / JW/NM-WN-LF) TaxID=457570 RepID=B2A224_NATTJ|nr:macro domain-containing protein [Natranaerobius thermophilus]ACB84829.1 Appr-1-p processing domain protein [Natranaerobius thermophilus JW/NM-WN-LF]